jgi:hypothetical protein
LVLRVRLSGGSHDFNGSRPDVAGRAASKNALQQRPALAAFLLLAHNFSARRLEIAAARPVVFAQMFASDSRLFGRYAPVPLNDVAVPPFPALEADDEEEGTPESRDFDFERPQAEWQPLPPAPPPEDVPVRFIDGSIASRTCGSITVDGRRRPLIAATISAACLEIEGRTLRRTAARTSKVLCVAANGIDPADLTEAEQLLQQLDVKLLTNEPLQTGDFDSMRRSTRARAMTAMEEAEREVMLADLSRPTLVDGLLERRLQGERQDLPVIGLVKRQIATYLPPLLQELAYDLRPGERTPAFLLRTVQHVDILNCYVRLSQQAGASPSYGLVRMTAPLDYAAKTYSRLDIPAFLSGLAGYIYRLRHRDLAYERAGISIEPIVRVEEHLHALRPNVDVLIQKLHPLLRGARMEVTSGVD